MKGEVIHLDGKLMDQPEGLKQVFHDIVIDLYLQPAVLAYQVMMRLGFYDLVDLFPLIAFCRDD